MDHRAPREKAARHARRGMNTIVVGGGWAGLSAAVHAVRKGHSVTLIESAAQLGGRARSVELQGRELDNGQHLVIGAYRHYLELLQILDIPASSLFDRISLKFVLRDLHGHDREINTPRLPAPLHLVAALLRAQGFSFAEKRAAISFCVALVVRRFRCPAAWTVMDLVQHYHQPRPLIRALWEPLCIATLNTPLNKASALVFLRVLREAFTHRNTDSDLLIPKKPIGSWLVQPATGFLQRHQGHILLKTRVTALKTNADHIVGVVTDDGSFLAADHVILAVPPFAASSLLRELPITAPLSVTLDHIAYEPIATLYFTYSPNIQMEIPMLGVLGGVIQWVFDRRFTGDAGVIAVVISAASAYKNESNESLIANVTAELAQLFPHWPSPLQTHVIREKRATFLCTPEMQTLRPTSIQAIRGLSLAGDYLDHGFPATLEGAVISGMNAAASILG